MRRQWQREWLTAPPFTPAFEGAKPEFAALLKADGFALFEKVLVWFQAQHTIPSPLVLGNIKSPVEGLDNVAVADMLGWPSDFAAWGRLIDWIISESDSIPVRLIPRILEVFDVWQNAAADLKNGRSKAILELANTWLLRFEKGELRDKSGGHEEEKFTVSRDYSSLVDGFSEIDAVACRGTGHFMQWREISGDVRFWPKADTTVCAAHVRFRG